MNQSMNYGSKPVPDGKCGFGCPVPVMAYIEFQPWGEAFDAETGYLHGTIFPELVKPWAGKGGAFS